LHFGKFALDGWAVEVEDLVVVPVFDGLTEDFVVEGARLEDLVGELLVSEALDRDTVGVADGCGSNQRLNLTLKITKPHRVRNQRLQPSVRTWLTREIWGHEPMHELYFWQRTRTR
jgi:hypothetical protein